LSQDLEKRLNEKIHNIEKYVSKIVDSEIRQVNDMQNVQGSADMDLGNLGIELVSFETRC
jgi:hypothetical protein